MFKRTTLIWLGLLLLFLPLSACNSASSDETVAEAANSNHANDNDHHDNDDEHANDMPMDDQNTEHMHLHVDVPADFAGMTNPLAANAANIAAGEELFETYCVTCHGEYGEGDGPGAVSLDPQPANLADGRMMSLIGDDYIFWRINKGGAIEPFNSAMPSWELALDETQTWQLVLYVRTLPDHEHEGGGHD